MLYLQASDGLFFNKHSKKYFYLVYRMDGKFMARKRIAARWSPRLLNGCINSWHGGTLAQGVLHLISEAAL